MQHVRVGPEVGLAMVTAAIVGVVGGGIVLFLIRAVQLLGIRIGEGPG